MARIALSASKKVGSRETGASGEGAMVRARIAELRSLRRLGGERLEAGHAGKLRQLLGENLQADQWSPRSASRISAIPAMGVRRGATCSGG